jgi:ABC-type polar amino acid transport system ATPase subunit
MKFPYCLSGKRCRNSAGHLRLAGQRWSVRLQGAVSTIAAEAVSKSFGEVEVLRQVTLRVPEKEVVCVIGPSGSGKTTLLRCLALLETPSAGRVTMNGVTIASPKSDAAQKRAARAVRPDIGMVFQHFNLWPHMRVIDNVIEAPLRVKGMSRDAAVALAETLLDKVGLSEKRDVYPARLSGGQQQRVAIARALAMSPKVMLFDEVTSALDPELRREVLLVMRQLAAEGMTMLVVTHEMGFARSVGTRLVFMDRGEIVEDTKPVTFFSTPKTDRAQRFLMQFED